MPKLRFVVIYMLITNVFANCISDVAVDIENSAAEIVLNSILNPNKDTVFVTLSYTKYIGSEESFDAVNKAEIQLFTKEENLGKFIDTGSGSYYLPLLIYPGKTYRIEAAVGNNKVWAETTVPENVEATIQIDNPENFQNNYLVLLKDDQQNENFYWISATGFEGAHGNQKKNIACVIYSNFEYADDFNQRIYNNGIFRFEYEYYLRFTDLQLTKQKTEIVIKPQCISHPEEIFILSTDYHLDKYMKSSLLLQEMELFSEEMPIVYSPQPVYSNINGGTGIFGSFNSVSKVFEKN